MTWTPREHRDGLEADRQAGKEDRCWYSGMPKRTCPCIRCDPAGFVARMAAKKAENDRLGRPSPPLGRYVRKL